MGLLNLSNLKALNPLSLKLLNNYLQDLVKGRLWLKVLIGMFAGVVLGFVLGPSLGWVSQSTADSITNWLALPGQIFLGLIQMIVIPLIFGSVILGIAASEDVESLKKIGLRAVAFFLATTTVAILLGIALAMVLKPGKLLNPDLVRSAISVPAMESNVPPVSMSLPSIPQAIENVLPKNPLGSMLNLEMLQVVVFAIIFGIALVSLPPAEASPLLKLLGALQQVCMVIVRWAMLLAPLAVFGLMTRLSAKLGLEALIGMGAYVGTVLLGLAIFMGFYLVIVLVVVKRSPLAFWRKIRDLQLLAFSTSSSAAVMPMSIKTAEENLNIRPSIAQFIIPLGATINMAGTALYQGVATIFLAQIFDIDLGFGALLLVVVTAVAASVGSPATPGVGMVILATILSSVGIPLSGVAILLGVDRILDMSRTAVNVAGDLVAAAVLDKWSSPPSNQATKF